MPPPPTGAPLPSHGIKGCVKDRILHDMIDATPGKFKILIADTTCTAILNSCMKMDDLMSHDVTLVENIVNKRQPISTSPAIYFVSPTADNVTRIVQDWATRDMYSEAHIFFVSVSSNDVLRDLRGSRLARERKVKTLKDLLISFQAPERLVFTLAEKTDLPYFFGNMAPSATARDQRNKMANQLSAALYTLSSEVVVIRHQNTPTASEFAGALQESYDLLKGEAAKLGETFRKNTRNPAPTTVIVVDRSVDACAPLVHDLYYQAMLDDFMPLQDGIYNQKFKDRTGKDSTRSFVVDEGDAHWCNFRHKHFSVCLSEIPKLLQELIKANPQLASGMKSGGGGATLADLGAAVRALPQFQEQQSRLSMHIDILEKLFDAYKLQKFDTLCDIEQRIVNGADAKGRKPPFKEIYDDVAKLGKDIAVRVNDKLRLLALFFLCYRDKEFSGVPGMEKLDKLAQDCGFTGKNDPAIAAIPLLAPPTTKSTGCNPPGNAPKTFKASLVGTFYSHVKTIMESAVAGSLDEVEFPYKSQGGAAKLSAALVALGGASAKGGATKSLRSALLSKSSKAGAADAGGAAVDLGGGSLISLNPKAPRVVVFMLGGATRGEMRAAYDVTRDTGAEVILGGTSLCIPSMFVSQLVALA